METPLSIQHWADATAAGGLWVYTVEAGPEQPPLPPTFQTEVFKQNCSSLPPAPFLGKDVPGTTDRPAILPDQAALASASAQQPEPERMIRTVSDSEKIILLSPVHVYATDAEGSERHEFVRYHCQKDGSLLFRETVVRLRADDGTLKEAIVYDPVGEPRQISGRTPDGFLDGETCSGPDLVPWRFGMSFENSGERPEAIHDALARWEDLDWRVEAPPTGLVRPTERSLWTRSSSTCQRWTTPSRQHGLSDRRLARMQTGRTRRQERVDSMNADTRNLTTCGLWILFGVLACCFATADARVTAVTANDDLRMKYTVSREGADPVQLDLAKVQIYYEDTGTTGPIAAPPAGTATRFPPVSPDGRYVAFGDAAVCDTNTGEWRSYAYEDDITQRLNLHGSFSERWVTPTRIANMYGPKGYSRMRVIYDIEEERVIRCFEAEHDFAADSAGEHISAIYGEGFYFRCPVNYPQPDLDLGDSPSNLLRYDDRVVYPLLLPWRFETYGDLHTQSGYLTGGDDHLLRKPGYGTGKHYVFSGLAFVGDTHWVAFIEQVYAEGEPAKVLETNLVAVDASRLEVMDQVDEGAVQVTKKSISPVQPEGGYHAFRRDFVMRWNDETGRLELWRQKVESPEKWPQAFVTSYALVAKVAEIVVNLQPFEFVEFLPEGGEIPEDLRKPSMRPW